MPVSLTEISTAPLICLALIPIRPPSGVNLTALDRRLSSICLILRSSPTKSPSRSSTVTSSVMPCLCGALAHEGAGVVDGQGKIERGQLQLHAARLRPWRDRESH